MLTYQDVLEPIFKKYSTDFYQYRCRADNHYGYPRLIESHVLNINELSIGNKHSKFKNIFMSLIEVSKFFIYINLVGKFTL